MILLLGISHNYQWDKNEVYCTNFINYLKRTIPKLNIKVMAEEWAIDHFQEWAYKSIHSTSIYDVANELRIKHIYADTDRATDKKIGIKRDGDIKSDLGIKGCELCMKKEDKKKYNQLREPNHRKREQYWLSQIDWAIKEKMLFICGYLHIPSFSQLLTDRGITNEILPETFITPLPKCYLCG